MLLNAATEQLFFIALDTMWKGMLGIFIVTAVIILFIFILNKAGQEKEKIS